MATGGDVLTMLIPTGGWLITGDDYDSIRYDEGVTPITEKQFIDGFAKFDAWKVKEDEAKADTKNALLERLGITADEVALLLG